MCFIAKVKGQGWRPRVHLDSGELNLVLGEVRTREPGGGLGGDRRSWRRSGGGSREEVREEVRLRGTVKRYG